MVLGRRIRRATAVALTFAAAWSLLLPAAHAAIGPATSVRIRVTNIGLVSSINVGANDASGAATPGATVTIWRASPQGTVVVGVVTTDANGSATIVDPTLTLTEVTYRATLANGAIAVQTFDRLPALPRVNTKPLAPLGDRVSPLPDYVDMVVDDAHNRVFVSTGGQLLVFDAEGKQLGAVTGEVGAQGLTLSNDSTTLFALEPAGPVVDVIDTGSMALIGHMPVPARAGVTPFLHRLGRAADRLVVSYDGAIYGGAIGAIPLSDPAHGAISATLDAREGDLIAGDPVHPRAIIVGSFSAAWASGWDVSGPVPVETLDQFQFPSADPTWNAQSVRYSTDGSDLYLGSASPYYGYRLDPATWSERSEYVFGAYPVATTPTRDNLFVAGTRVGYGSGPQIWDHLGIVKLREFDSGSAWQDYQAGALDFSGDSSRLYAVRLTGPYGQEHLELATWANPLVPCSLQMNGTLDYLGTHLSVQVVLSNSSTPLAAIPITLSYSTAAGTSVGFGGAVSTATNGSVSSGATLPAGVDGTDVTATALLPGAVAPCTGRVHVQRALPPVLHVPSAPPIAATPSGHGWLSAYWYAPADNGGLPITIYSFIAVDPRGAIRAWVNVPGSGFGAGAALPKGTYTVYVLAWNRLGPGASASAAGVVVT